MEQHVTIGVRVSKTLKEKIVKHMERERKKDPMYNLSDAIRDLLQKAVET